MNTNLLVTQQQRPQPRRVAAAPEAPELQEVREDDVRDARGAQLVQSARGLVPVEVLLRRRARPLCVGRVPVEARALRRPGDAAGRRRRRVVPERRVPFLERRVARRVHFPSEGRRVVHELRERLGEGPARVRRLEDDGGPLGLGRREEGVDGRGEVAGLRRVFCDLWVPFECSPALPRLSRETRRLSDDHEDDVAATRSHEDAIAAPTPRSSRLLDGASRLSARASDSSIRLFRAPDAIDATLSP